jgi:hypothetical protein
LIRLGAFIAGALDDTRVSSGAPEGSDDMRNPLRAPVVVTPEARQIVVSPDFNSGPRARERIARASRAK